MSVKPVIAILGEPAISDSGLAKRWVAAGYSVVHRCLIVDEKDRRIAGNIDCRC